jgi:hypothetical protein
MNNAIQNVSNASASSSASTRRFVIVFNAVDYGLLAMLLVTLVSIGASLVVS